MDSYIAKIKNDAESLIKTIFPAKALELDSAVNVKKNYDFVIIFSNNYLLRRMNFQHQK
jgi:hypothetical protein